MLSFFIGFIGSIIALIGWFGYHSLPILIIGTIMYVIESFMDRNNLNKGAKMVDIIIVIIGAIVSVFITLPWYVCSMLAISIYSFIVSIPGLLYYLNMALWLIKPNKKN